MREFFKPCRRKLGMVTLGLACVFAAGWVRSLSVDDFIQLPTVQTMAVGTEPGCLLLFREAEAVLISEVPGLDVAWENVDGIENPMPQVATMVANSYFEKAGSIPHWSLVFPLTLLSAWLLISKPRPVKKPDPSPTTGT